MGRSMGMAMTTQILLMKAVQNIYNTSTKTRGLIPSYTAFPFSCQKFGRKGARDSRSWSYSYSHRSFKFGLREGCVVRIGTGRCNIKCECYCNSDRGPQNDVEQFWPVKLGVQTTALGLGLHLTGIFFVYVFVANFNIYICRSRKEISTTGRAMAMELESSMQANEGTSEIYGTNVDKMKSWVYELKEQALQRGVKREVVEMAFEGVTISETILEIDQNCPEVKLTAEEYLKRVVTDERVSKGVEAFKKHQALLEEVSLKYGVPAVILVAIWGVESSYGAFTGGFDTIQALITMSYGRQESGKSKYFREEIFNALSILEQGHGPPGNKRLQGSYAGAMGQCQFMPSSFLSYSVDHDGDGRADIWESYADIFASIANYLLKHGWKGGSPIAHKVCLDKDIDQSLLGLNVKKPVCEWKKDYKVMLMEEKPEVSAYEMASLIAPDGLQADAYLVYDNFRTIMRYNICVLYSISVYDLTEKILRGLVQEH